MSAITEGVLAAADGYYFFLLEGTTRHEQRGFKRKALAHTALVEKKLALQKARAARDEKIRQLHKQAQKDADKELGSVNDFRRKHTKLSDKILRSLMRAERIK